MIGKINGKLIYIENNEGIIDTKSGLSYRVYIPKSLYDKLNSEVEIITYLVVREDSLTLYGFNTFEEHSIFSSLLSVDGVGPKVAYSIIQNTQINEIKNAILYSDSIFFQKIPGIGKKTSQKIVLELSGRLDITSMQNKKYSDEDKLVIDALVSLGFIKKDIEVIYDKLSEYKTVEDKIKNAIKILTKKHE